MGLRPSPDGRPRGAAERVESIRRPHRRRHDSQLESQGVRLVRGRGGYDRTRASSRCSGGLGGRAGERRARGGRDARRDRRLPRVPDWAEIDGTRVADHRQAYPPRTIPEHLVVIGSGVTGVEFVHMFRSLGSRGDTRRLPPAGAADEGSRGRRRARGRFREARRPADQRGTGRRRRPMTDGVTVSAGGRSAIDGPRFLAIGSVLPPPASASSGRRRDRATGGYVRSTSTASRISPTSTPVVTCQDDSSSPR